MTAIEARRDLRPFHIDLTWDQRFALIQRTFAGAPLMGPESTETEAAWRRAFDHDIELLGRILRDVLKSEQAVAGRPGPRPNLDRTAAEPIVDEWLGRDPSERPYSLLSFAQSFALLVGGRSLRHVARMTSIHYVQVYRLLKGEIAPTRVMMERVAVAFDKDPSYFTEYRVGMVAMILAEKLSTSPEFSVRAYEALYWAAAQ